MRPRIRTAAARSPGRGGQQHKYLQTLIKRYGEDRGFRATVEQTVLDGHGGIDVALERGDVRIAFEITITTRTTHELGNIARCLAAGFHHVVLAAIDSKAQKRLTRALSAEFQPEQASRSPACYLKKFRSTSMPPRHLPVSAVTSTAAGYKVSV